MSFRRITTGAVVLVALAMRWGAYSLYSCSRGILDAYAAWDAGTLVVAYLQSHDDQWPRSWDALLAVAETLNDHDMRLRGSDGEGGFVYGELRNRVAIDWNADPKMIVTAQSKQGEPPIRVVTRADGTDFPVVWAGAEPNEMIRTYLMGRNLD